MRTSWSTQASSGLRPAIESGRTRFSSAVRTGSRLKNWKTKPSLSRRSLVSSPSSSLVMSIAVELDRAGGRFVEPGEDVHQGRLARARGAHDRGEAVALEGGADAVEGIDGGVPLAVAAVDVGGDDDWSVGAHCPARYRSRAIACGRGPRRPLRRTSDRPRRGRLDRPRAGAGLGGDAAGAGRGGQADRLRHQQSRQAAGRLRRAAARAGGRGRRGADRHRRDRRRPAGRRGGGRGRRRLRDRRRAAEGDGRGDRGAAAGGRGGLGGEGGRRLRPSRLRLRGAGDGEARARTRRRPLRHQPRPDDALPRRRAARHRRDPGRGRDRLRTAGRDRRQAGAAPVRDGPRGARRVPAAWR